MSSVFDYIHRMWINRDLRNKILFVIFALIMFRVAAKITVPGVDISALENLFAQNQLLGAFSILTGGSMENFSIVLMGLTPYINASIIMQLMTVIIPRLEEMKKEGGTGVQKIQQWTRYLTLPLAFLQSYGMIILLNNSAGHSGGNALIPNIGDPMVILPIMLTVTAGTMFLMWLGEIMTEKGIGNGISLLIFTSIIAGVPPVLGQSLGIAQFDTSRLVPIAILAAITLALMSLVVLVTEGVRNVPVTYARRGTKGSTSHLPIRVNQAGMIPIIFAVSLITFPVIIAQFAQTSTNATVREVSSWIMNNLNAAAPGLMYVGLFFGFVMAFTFFYVSITFNPTQVAENIQKRGGFVPGLRPGSETAKFLGRVSNLLNIWGGSFLGFVAVLPIILQMLFVNNQSFGSVPLLISGAGLIIVVGVVLEVIRQVKAQMITHDYSKFK